MRVGRELHEVNQAELRTVAYVIVSACQTACLCSKTAKKQRVVIVGHSVCTTSM